MIQRERAAVERRLDDLRRQSETLHSLADAVDEERTPRVDAYIDGPRRAVFGSLSRSAGCVDGLTN